MVHHGVVVWTLPASRLADAFRLGMRSEVHMGRVYPNEERLVGGLLPLDKVHGSVGDVIIDTHHSGLGQRAGILAHLLADFSEARINCGIVSVRSLAIHHTPWSEFGKKLG